MSLIKLIIGLPLLILLAVFTFGNNSSSEIIDLGFEFLGIKISARLDLVIIILLVFGYVMGRFDSWLSNSSLRKKLRSQTKQNKKLNEQQQKLSVEVEELKETIDSVKPEVDEEPTISFATKLDNTKEKFKNIFKKKSSEKQEEYW